MLSARRTLHAAAGVYVGCRMNKTCITVGLLLCLSGCVGKPGTRVNLDAAKDAAPVTIEDPTGAHGVTVLGFNRDTTVNGPLVTETSKLDDTGLQETNTGGAAKQRVTIVVLPDGTIRAGGSAASDLSIGEVESTWTPSEFGTARTLVFRNIKTDIAVVSRLPAHTINTLCSASVDIDEGMVKTAAKN